MTLQYRALPTYDTDMMDKRVMSASWRRWFRDTDVGTPPAAEASVTVTASPFTYQATQRGFLIVNGGTVSQIQFGRSAKYVTGQTSGIFPVSFGDMLIVTYSGKPTITFVPQ